MSKPFTIGITGGSGSGKTYFLQGLSACFGAHEICLISQDNYYKPRDQQPIDENGIKNFDLPVSIDSEAFRHDLLILKSGRNVIKQEYTFNNPLAETRMLEFKSAPIIVVEGLFVQYFEEICNELDLRIFIEAKDHVKLGRRIKRDQVERGYDIDDVLYRYQYHVMPVYERLIEPLKHHADLVIPNNSKFERALDVLVAFLKTRLGWVANLPTNLTFVILEFRTVLKKRVYRSILMVVGLLAATVIVLSHVFKAPEEIAEKKPATEQSAKSESKTVISAPSEAVMQGTAVQVDEQAPQTLLEVLAEPQSNTGFVPVAKELFSSFLKTLFRVIISPNAPWA